MSLSTDKIIEGLLTGDTEEIKALSKLALNFIDAISSDVKQLLTNMALGMVDIKIAQIDKLKAAGFSQDEAILMVQDEWYALQKSLRSRTTK